MNRTKSVLLVEPDAYRRQRYVVELSHERDFQIVGWCASKREASRLLTRETVDFAVVSMRLPDGNGAELIRNILKRNEKAHVLVACDIADENIVMQAIVAGADGYILFSDESFKLVECLNLMASGGSPISPEVSKSVLRALHCRTDSKIPVPENSPLSPRELEITRLIARGTDFQNIGQLLAISESTVMTHVKKIYHKLGVHSRAQALIAARQLKLID